MKTFLTALLTFAVGAAHASTLYKCTDSAGHSVYTNFKAQNKNCVVLSHDNSTAAAEARPVRASASTTTPADFPRVSSETQRSRDSDRRHIVEQELDNEQKNLEEARKNLAEQEATRLPDDQLKPFRDRIALHERNLVELQRELSKLR